MELTLSQLKEITLGALKITEDADGFRFSRMTAAQAAVFTGMNETFERKCHTNSGVRLDFETDSSFLEMRWNKPVFAAKNEEDHWMTARNKWLLAHPESKEAKNGAHIGLSGVNINIKEDL